MRSSFKPREAKDRSYNRCLKKEFIEGQYHKLPNEFRHLIKDYNYKNASSSDVFHIDDNTYDYK